MGDGADSGIGRKTTDLLERPFVFSQQPLLRVDDFIDAYKQRVTYGRRPESWEVLAALHQGGLLVPFLRVTPDIEAFIEREKHLPNYWSYQLSRYLQQPRLVINTIRGHHPDVVMTDPRLDQPQSWRALIKRYEGQTFWTSAFFFSHYQLLLIPLLRPIVDRMRLQPSHSSNFPPRGYPEAWLETPLPPDFAPETDLLRQVNENTELAIVLSALEVHYLPAIKGAFNRPAYRASFPEDIEEVIRHSRRADAAALLAWTGWSPEQVWASFWRLAHMADAIDPLKDWQDLAQLCHPDQLNKLRGDALIALDHRRAAEMLLRFYQDLARAGVAPAKDMYTFWTRRFHGDPDQRDATLVKFGLMRPSHVVLVVPGIIGSVITQVVLEYLGLDRRSQSILIVKGDGVHYSRYSLPRFAADPLLGGAPGDPVKFARPPTHFVVVLEPGTKRAAPIEPEPSLRRWIDAIWPALARVIDRTPALQRELGRLVHFETWGDLAFEYAHFTDQELAWAIVEVYGRAAPVSVDKLADIVAARRAYNASLEKVWDSWPHPRPSQARLARQLGSILKDKIERAAPDQLDQIPVVRVLRRAYDLAARIPRNDVVIPYQPPDSDH